MTRPLDVRALHEALVAVPSVSGNEQAAAALVAQTAADMGYRPEQSGCNVWFRRGTGTPTLLVNSHLDTVPPAAGWSSDPFVPRRVDDRLYGLGANDAKGCVAALLGAAARLAGDRPPPRGSVLFALTAEEETGGAAGITSVLDRFGPLAGAIVGEPTGLNVCTSQRGMLLLRCTARGVAGHPANAEAQGAVNAIHVAAHDIVRLSAMRFVPHPLLGETRAHVTTVAGGVKRNQVPDRCEFFVDFRTTPDLDHDDLAARVARELASEVVVHSRRYRPKATPPDATVLRAALHAAAAVGAGAAGIGSATVSDWAFLGDTAAVKAGPGDTLRSHTADEYLCDHELAAGVVFYETAVRAWLAEANHG